MVLWIFFIAMVIGIAYLSFQNGEETKLIGQQFIAKLAAAEHPGEVVTQEELDTLTYDLRQSARAVAFLFIGMFGTFVIYISCPRCHWLIKTGIAACFLFAIAYFTEKLKIYIPTRHYNHEEMMISIISVAIGFLVVTCMTLTVKAVKGIARLVTTTHAL